MGSMMEVSANEQVFLPNKILLQFYWISTGVLSYRKGGKQVEPVEADAWLGEHPIWVSDWISMGELLTMNHCQIIVLNIVEIQKSVTENAHLWSLMCAYAQGFYGWLRDIDGRDLSDHFKFEDQRPRAELFMQEGLA